MCWKLQENTRVRHGMGPGGLGPALASRGSGRRWEMGLAHGLRVGHACYSRRLGHLYYSDDGKRRIAAIIDAVRASGGLELTETPVPTDDHGIFCSTWRVDVPERAASALLLALRMEGVEVSMERAAG